MLYIPPISELSFYGVVEAGVPNRERICLRPSEDVNLGRFGIMLAHRDAESGGLTPIRDFFFWFGEFEASPPAWIIVFTGSGEEKSIFEKGVDVHVFYWGKKHTLFNIAGRNIVPVVFNIGQFNLVPVLPSQTPAKQISRQ